jgi:hypothetical protein
MSSLESLTFEELWDDHYTITPKSQTFEYYMKTPERETLEDLWDDDYMSYEELREGMDLPKTHTTHNEIMTFEESWDVYFIREYDDYDSMSYDDLMELQERVGSITTKLSSEALDALYEIAFEETTIWREVYNMFEYL